MEYDAIVIGSGPNGLAAAIELARAGCSVCVFERSDSIGGGAHSSYLTLPGFVHDVCSAIHPLGLASPFFRTLPLAEHGLAWIHPPAPLAHPLDGGTAVMVERSVDQTADGLGADGAAYRSLMGPIAGGLVRSLDELPERRLTLLDLTPRQIVRIAGDRLPPRYRRRLQAYRYGAAAFKLDYALDGPIPWTAAGCARAGTVHLGGTLEEIVASEAAVGRGEPPQRPYVLLAQQSLFDDSRAPAGKHPAWAYCPLPHGATFDMTERAEAQIERFAPGFGKR